MSAEISLEKRSTIVILVSGYMGSGKDTFSEFLIKYLPDAKKYAFADSIKEIARKYFNWDGIKDEKGRQLLIGIGAAGREENPFIWAERVIEKIKEKKPAYAVISDWRFKNEHRKILEEFGFENVVTIRIERNKVEPIDDISEHDLDNYPDFDFIIKNSSSLQELEKQAEKTAKYIKSLKIEEAVEGYEMQVISSLKIKLWLKDGKLHRDDGPSVVEYYQNGRVESKMWFADDKFHREEGPAVIKYQYISTEPDKEKKIEQKEYFIEGRSISEEEFMKYTKIKNLLKSNVENKKISLV